MDWPRSTATCRPRLGLDSNIGRLKGFFRSLGTVNQVYLHKEHIFNTVTCKFNEMSKSLMTILSMVLMLVLQLMMINASSAWAETIEH